MKIQRLIIFVEGGQDLEAKTINNKLCVNLMPSFMRSA
jgi:hypothetical protein